MSRHERTLIALRRHPRPSNLRWADIESLLVHFGAVVKEGKGSAISVTLKGRTAYFHRPHPDEKANKGAIVTALKLLEAGDFGSYSLFDHSDEGAPGGGR